MTKEERNLTSSREFVLGVDILARFISISASVGGEVEKAEAASVEVEVTDVCGSSSPGEDKGGGDGGMDDEERAKLLLLLLLLPPLVALD